MDEWFPIAIGQVTVAMMKPWELWLSPRQMRRQTVAKMAAGTMPRKEARATYAQINSAFESLRAAPCAGCEWWMSNRRAMT